jgi:DNA topoisomerase-1
MQERDQQPAGAKSQEVAFSSNAGLVYICDAEPGIRRQKRGRGFSYLMAGKPVREADTLQRIKALAIPPAWTDVWICRDPLGHLQATGRDDRGRKQYCYHPAWTTAREEAKFSTLAVFARALPRLRKRIELDLKTRGASRERIIASIVWLLDKTLIRIGNENYAQQNKTFGLTTLRARHLTVEGSSLRFSFVGKSGREWKLRLSDRRVASVVRAIQELPGQHLFQYRDSDGVLHDIHSHDVNDYIREATGDDFTSKHFRTWGATVLAASSLAETPLPPARGARVKILNQAIDAVAGKLRNTRAVCRTGYIHPAVIEAWNNGTLQAELQRAARGHPAKGLSPQETTVLRWLSGPVRRHRGQNRVKSGNGRKNRIASADECSS